MKAKLKRLGRRLSQIPAVSAVALLGILLIGAGVWLMSPAWSLIVVGGLCWLDSAFGPRK